MASEKKLSVVIDAKIDKLQKGLEQVQTDTKKMSNGFGVAAVAIGNFVANAAQKIIGELGGAIKQVFEDTLNYADSVSDIAESTGMTTGEVQKLGYALRLEGRSLNDITSVVKFMSSAMERSAEETDAMKNAFVRLGVNFEDFQTLGVAQQIDTLFRALSSVSNANERAILTTDVFGRSGMDLLPVIQTWGERQDRLNQMLKDFGIPPEAINSLSDAKVESEAFKIAIEHIGHIFMKQLAPHLPGLIENLSKLATKFGEILEAHPDAITNLTNLADSFLKIGDGILAIMDAWNKLPALLRFFLGGGTPLSTFALSEMQSSTGVKSVPTGDSPSLITSPGLIYAGRTPEVMAPLADLVGMGGGGTHIHNYNFAGFVTDEMALNQFAREIEKIHKQNERRRVYTPNKTEYYSTGGHL